MKPQFRLYQRSNGGRFYLHNNVTGKQESLGTTDRKEAARLLHAKNEASRHPLLNVQIARAYLAANDMQVGTRNWQDVMNEITKFKQASTLAFYRRAFKQKAFESIRKLPIVESRPEHFFHVLGAGTVATNKNLRRLHSYALSMTWLPWPILTKKQWPELRYKNKRGITREEHLTILAKELNPEWKAFLELLWHVGPSQGDMAALRAEDIDVEYRVIKFPRQKTRSLTVQRYGETVAAILTRLPKSGLLFPKLSQHTSSNRAARFSKAVKRRGVVGVSLHSYRYAWAERAKTSGYPERYAQEALGHKSKAVHRFYAKMAKVELPPLEDYEKRRSEEMVFTAAVTRPSGSQA